MRMKINATITENKLFGQNDTIVLAISGGIDSMVMLHLFADFAKTFNLTVIVAHLNHSVRADAALDLELVQQVVTKMGFSFEHDVLPPMGATGNFHDYARKYRYEFFLRTAKKYGATKIATAHHADDQLETVIHRLLRSGNPTSLIGLRPKTMIAEIALVRPLLDASKSEISEYAQKHAVIFREDETNALPLYTRNRIRQQIIPILKAEEPVIDSHIKQLSQNLHDDDDYFNDQLTQLLTQIMTTNDGFEFSYPWFIALHPSLSRRLILKLIPHIRQKTLVDLQKWLRSTTNAQLDVGDKTVVKKVYEKVIITKQQKQATTTTDYDFLLTIGKEVQLPDGRKLILQKKCAKRGSNGTYLCYNSKRMPLRVRNRRPGDRIALANNGHAKVKQIMIDAKIPLANRDSWPVIVDAYDVIIWIPGLKKSSACLTKAIRDNDLWLEIIE